MIAGEVMLKTFSIKNSPNWFLPPNGSYARIEKFLGQCGCQLAALSLDLNSAPMENSDAGCCHSLLHVGDSQ